MFTLPFDLLLIFTVVSQVLGWVSPKRYRAKICGVFAAVVLVVVGVALFGLYQDVAANTAIFLPSNALNFATLRVDALSIFMTAIFLGLGFAATITQSRMLKTAAESILLHTDIALISGMIV
jgi:hypothetical protein